MSVTINDLFEALNFLIDCTSAEYENADGVNDEDRKENEPISSWDEYATATINKIAIGVIKKRVFNCRIPFIEHHAFIAKTSRGTISVHYERNKERPILNQIDNPDSIDSEWELTQYFLPRRGITVADLDMTVGKFWIFPSFRYIQAVLPTLFERGRLGQREIDALKREWAQISLFQYTLRKVSSIKQSIKTGPDHIKEYIKACIKESIKACSDNVLSFIRTIFSFFF